MGWCSSILSGCLPTLPPHLLPLPACYLPAHSPPLTAALTRRHAPPPQAWFNLVQSRSDANPCSSAMLAPGAGPLAEPVAHVCAAIVEAEIRAAAAGAHQVGGGGGGTRCVYVGGGGQWEAVGAHQVWIRWRMGGRGRQWGRTRCGYAGGGGGQRGAAGAHQVCIRRE